MIRTVTTLVKTSSMRNTINTHAKMIVPKDAHAKLFFRKLRTMRPTPPLIIDENGDPDYDISMTYSRVPLMFPKRTRKKVETSGWENEFCNEAYLSRKRGTLLFDYRRTLKLESSCEVDVGDIKSYLIGDYDEDNISEFTNARQDLKILRSSIVSS